LHNALCRIFRSADQTARLGVLTAHPDLAGKLAAAKRLTDESTCEQASAGLDAITDSEREIFIKQNGAYTAKHGFPLSSRRVITTNPVSWPPLQPASAMIEKPNLAKPAAKLSASLFTV